MTGTEIHYDILVVRKRQKTPRRGNAPVADDHRPVVKRRALIEDIAEEEVIQIGIHRDAGFDYISQLCRPFENDQRTGS